MRHLSELPHRQRSILAVLPAYNADVVIEQMVLQVYHVLSELSDSFEMVVTNGGSRQGRADLQERRPHLLLQIVTCTGRQAHAG